MSKEFKKSKYLYIDLNKKYKKTTTFFLIINLTIFFIGAAIIVLNIFAIRKNPSSDPITKWIFVSVAIATAIATFISSITSLYVFRKKNKTLNEKITLIDIERKQFKRKVLAYTEPNPEVLLLRRIETIING